MTIELVTTDGIFALDGGEWAVTNNIWLVGDDREVVVFDAAHDYETIVGAIDGRRVKAIVLTPRAVNQMPTTGQAARKKWRLRLLLKEAYWKIRRPK